MYLPGMNLPNKQGLYDPRNERDSCGVGFIVNVNGEESFGIVKKGLEILKNMEHRGATGSDPKTGDGAGILIQIPDDFFRIYCNNDGIDLPKKGDYGIGMVFLPKEPALRLQCEGIFERIIQTVGHKSLGWRFVPTDNRVIGETARGTEPVIRQVFIKKNKDISNEQFKRDLYLIRRKTENEVIKLVKRNREYFYICSLSSKTIVYKGLLLAEQIEKYYLDLNDINFKSAMALVHQRFSTNTFPTWDLAQPFRYLAHNGEINTIKGNRNWMNTREGVLKSKYFNEKLQDIYPIIQEGKSDSASVDNVFEFIKHNGRTNAHTLMMLIPEAWENDVNMCMEKKSFYEYHATMIEPWDGPAAMFFCDGIQIGGTLDRNGLRPAKYVITKDGMIIMASEFGVLKFNSDEIEKKGRLRPGEMLLVDINKKKVFFDEEIKNKICSNMQYQQIIEKNKVNLTDIKIQKENVNSHINNLLEKQKAFGYTMDDMKLILKSMAESGQELIGSMGNDTPLAVLSNKPQLLFSYFRQLFAQVTNPPIDPIREGVVMSLKNFLGTQENILNTEELKNKYMIINSPIISYNDMCKFKSFENKDFKATIIPITFKADSGIAGFKNALDLICDRALKRVKEGYNILILSDKKVDSYEGAIPSLLAVSAIHHYLIEEKQRSKVSLLVEAGDVRETTHFALLIGYGASAIYPYMAIESIKHLVKEKIIKNKNIEEAVNNYLEACNKGLAKILSKMGICTIQSYHGSQIFEILGLDNEFVENYFPGTPSRIGGIGLNEIAKEVLIRHEAAFNKVKNPIINLDIGGLYKWRRDGEFHLFNPETIRKLQISVREGDYNKYKEYALLINNSENNSSTIRSLLEFKNLNPIPIEEVEPESEIIKRFCSGAMSLGSISKEVHETIAIAMNKIGAKSNSGEGGEDSDRFNTRNNVNNLNSSIKQVASARFGVSIKYLSNADEIQIKIAQGAKPGEGGNLPGKKVNEYIAKLRHSVPGIDLISPPPHHDIYSIEDLAQLIFDLKNTNPEAKVSVKLVAENGVGTVAAGVAKAHADIILISGHDGGTGASPVSSIRNAGIPWEIGLSETHQVLLLNNLRSRVRLRTDGQLKTGRDVVIASLLGAEEFGFSSSILVTLGCVMLRDCHNNNCAMGIATQDEKLKKKFKGKPEYIVNYLTFIAKEVREYMALLGFRTINEMVGRVDKLQTREDVEHWKASKLDLSNILYKPDMPKRITPYCSKKQKYGLEESIDYKLIEISQTVLKDRKPISGTFEIKNSNRTVGTMLSGILSKKFGNEKLPDDLLKFKFYGSAGQSFGAFGINGLTLILEGDANDYVGKGLSGGKIIIRRPANATYEKSIIAGNTILYGATSGKLFINGIVGERFAIRNSGAEAVVEGVGNHGCEYMTSGFIVVLGEVGRNFAAGMSGGTAIIFDPENTLESMCNKEMILIENPTVNNLNKAKELIEEHLEYTDSNNAKMIIENWESSKKYFKRVIPITFKEITEKICIRER